MLLEPDGTLKAWLNANPREAGAPDALGLGHNRPIADFTLVTVPGLSNVVATAVGTGFSFAALGDGRLLAWGQNANGILGTTPLSHLETVASWSPASNVPVPLATRFDAVTVSAGNSHVLALARDGGVYAWGVGNEGQLGIGPMPVISFRTRTPSAMTYVPFPVRIPDLGDVTAVSAGGHQSLALLKDGTVRAWGSNRDGKLGDGTTISRNRPIEVKGVRDAVAIAAGDSFSMALLANGTVMMWGSALLGNTNGPTPVVVAGVRGARAIAAGQVHGVALTEAGTVMTWGDNAHHQLGRRAATPAAGVVPNLTGVQSIAAAVETTVAVLSSGRIMTWGVVRPWTRPDASAGGNFSPNPILLWVDGLEYS